MTSTSPVGDITPAEAPPEVTNDKQRRCWALLASGDHTLTSAANEVDVHRRTVVRWVEKWRITYGGWLFDPSKRGSADVTPALNALARTSTALAESWATLAEAAPDTIRALLARIVSDPDPRQAAIALGILTDKLLLIDGKATTRSEIHRTGNAAPGAGNTTINTIFAGIPTEPDALQRYIVERTHELNETFREAVDTTSKETTPP